MSCEAEADSSCHAKGACGLGDKGIRPPDKQNHQEGVNVTTVRLNEIFDEVRVMIPLTF